MPLSALFSLVMVLAQYRWALTQAKPREVGRLYWKLIPETEVWVHVNPEDPEGKPPLVNLVFHAVYPGRAERDPHTGLPQWPKGAPSRLTVGAEPLPMTVIRELSLRLAIDGTVIDLTGPSSRYRVLPCVTPSSDCVADAVEAELGAPVLRSIVGARHIAFKVRKKIFAYYTYDHHGDGRIALWCKAPPGEQDRLVKEKPARYFVPPYVGAKGWVALRLDSPTVDWRAVENLAFVAYFLSAPASLRRRKGQVSSEGKEGWPRRRSRGG
jgi:hypothetical protein